MPFPMPKKESSVKKSFPPKYRFLLNANLSRKIIPHLSSITGNDFIHISSISTRSLTDPEIITIAKKEKLIIITHDLDYGEIYYLKEQGNVGAIVLRLKDQTSANVTAKLTAFFSHRKYKRVNLSNSLVIITQENIRVFSPK